MENSSPLNPVITDPITIKNEEDYAPEIKKEDLDMISKLNSQKKTEESTHSDKL